MSKRERMNIFNMPTMVNPDGFILSKITSTEEYIKNKYASSFRNMQSRLKYWADEEIKIPIYKSPNFKRVDERKMRNRSSIDMFDSFDLKNLNFYKRQKVEDKVENILEGLVEDNNKLLENYKEFINDVNIINEEIKINVPNEINEDKNSIHDNSSRNLNINDISSHNENQNVSLPLIDQKRLNNSDLTSIADNNANNSILNNIIKDNSKLRGLRLPRMKNKQNSSRSINNIPIYTINTAQKHTINIKFEIKKKVDYFNSNLFYK